MRISNLGYLINEGLKGIFLRGFMSFAAVCVTVACLVIVGSFSILSYNMNVWVDQLNKTNEIRVFIDGTLREADAMSVGSKINNLENIHQIQYVTRDQALTEFKADYPDGVFDGVASEDLNYRFIVILEDNAKMAQTEAEIWKIPGVKNIRAESELAAGFAAMKQVLQVVSVAVIAVLLVVSLLIISNTVKLVMYDRRDEIAIMKMVGATNGFIRLPFLVEGLALGMLGAGIAFALEWLLYDTLVEKMAGIPALSMLEFVPFDKLLLPMTFTFVAAGLFVGIVGSWTSIRKFMDV